MIVQTFFFVIFQDIYKWSVKSLGVMMTKHPKMGRPTIVHLYIKHYAGILVSTLKRGCGPITICILSLMMSGCDNCEYTTHSHERTHYVISSSTALTIFIQKYSTAETHCL